MALSSGSRLGPYEVVSALGAGGMGEVYRARDTKLNRDVALKVLPDAFALDAERLARFGREAQVLASLNHPHIAAIYGFEESGGVRALVLELVEGPTLAERIEGLQAEGKGLPVDEALSIAKQIADALEAAHEQGIIHRDLKPANIKVRDDGTVKVLDFGLAKAMEPASAISPMMTAAATITTPAQVTGVGMILGTAAYMSPEQAKGRPADKRSDVWAFGCVLYEMLTGIRPFGGEDVSDTLAAVLRANPDWSALPAALPRSISTLVRRCLEKDRKRRIGDVAAVRFVIDELAALNAAPPAAPGPAEGRAPLWHVASTAVVSALLVGLVWFVVAWTRKSPALPVVRFPIVLPDDQTLVQQRTGVIALSPDGTRVAYESGGRLLLRPLSEMEAKPVAGVRVVRAPLFSPDGQWIAFRSTDGQLRKVAVSGGAAISICRIEGPFSGMSWDGDRIVFAHEKGIMEVSPDGGEPHVLIPAKPGEAMDTPQLLEGGKSVLFTDATDTGADRWDKAQIVVQSLATGQRKVVFRGGTAARYVPSGHLVYVVGNVLMAIAFDPKSLETRGGPVPAVEGIGRPSTNANGTAHFVASTNGSLVYLPGNGVGPVPTELTLVSRDGKVRPLGLPPQPYLHPRISPDGKSLAYFTDDGKDSIIWVYELNGASPPRRLTFGGRNQSPIWTPDGRRITFSSDREGRQGLYWQNADGSGTAERLLVGDPVSLWRPEAWTPDGKTLAFVNENASADIWTITRGEAKPRKVVDTPGNERYAEFSRDGRWLSYSSTENDTRGFNIFVQPYPPTGAKYEITTAGARTSYWSTDGKQLLFVNSGTGPGHIAAVDIHMQPAFSFEKPMELPVGDAANFVGAGRQYDVSPDGRQFVLVTAPGGGTKRAPSQINVVLNWFEDLKQRVPGK